MRLLKPRTIYRDPGFSHGYWVWKWPRMETWFVFFILKTIMDLLPGCSRT